MGSSVVAPDVFEDDSAESKGSGHIKEEQKKKKKKKKKRIDQCKIRTIMRMRMRIMPMLMIDTIGIIMPRRKHRTPAYIRPFI